MSKRINQHFWQTSGWPLPLLKKGLFPPRQETILQNALETTKTIDKGHGRREIRTLSTTTILNQYLDWPGVAQVGEIKATIYEGSKQTQSTRYFITSVPRNLAGAAKLLEWGRGHWSIENKSHYVRDTAFAEDASRIRKNAGPQIMAAFRNAAISFFRMTGVKNISAELRSNAYHVEDLLSKLGILK